MNPKGSPLIEKVCGSADFFDFFGKKVRSFGFFRPLVGWNLFLRERRRKAWTPKPGWPGCAGGYVLAAVVSFAAACALTLTCVRLHQRAACRKALKQDEVEENQL